MRFRGAFIWSLAAWLILLALPAVWAGSYWHSAAVLWMRSGHKSYIAAIDRGQFGLIIVPGSATVDSPPSWNFVTNVAGHYDGWRSKNLSDADSSVVFHGYGYGSYTVGRFSDTVTVLLPLWLLCLPAFAGIAMAARHLLRRRSRLRRSQCVQCGYDLRASSDYCPECGAERPARSP